MGQEASPREMDLHVTVLQTAIGLLFFLMQTQQVQGHWVCNRSLEIIPVPHSLWPAAVSHTQDAVLAPLSARGQYVVSICAQHSPTHSLRNQRSSSVMLRV